MKKFINSPLGISLICTALGICLAFYLEYRKELKLRTLNKSDETC